MPSFPILRQRHPTQAVHSAPIPVGGTVGGIYHFHEGDLVDEQDLALRAIYETPFERTTINTLWGWGGILVQGGGGQGKRPMPYQMPPTPMFPNVFTNGLGGLQAGEIYMQPLLDPGVEYQGQSA